MAKNVQGGETGTPLSSNIQNPYNSTDGVMVSVFDSSAVDRAFVPRSGQIKDY